MADRSRCAEVVDAADRSRRAEVVDEGEVDEGGAASPRVSEAESTKAIKPEQCVVDVHDGVGAVGENVGDAEITAMRAESMKASLEKSQVGWKSSMRRGRTYPRCLDCLPGRIELTLSFFFSFSLA